MRRVARWRRRRVNVGAGSGERMSETYSAIHVYISGYVQGVGYRWFARQQAMTLGLTGYARNLADRRVEVVAQGPRIALERFVEALRRGPEGASVDDVQVRWVPAESAFDGFAIRH